MSDAEELQKNYPSNNFTSCKYKGKYVPVQVYYILHLTNCFAIA